MMQDGKITDIYILAEKVESFRSKKKIVHCHGIFDLLHIGHIRYFEQARQMGDILVVTVTPDQFVNGGRHHPNFSESLRAEAVASLDCVDYVAINKWETAEETLRLLRPDFYVKGSEFQSDAWNKGNLDKEKKVLNEVGAKLAFTEDISFSSSSLINRYLSSLPEQVHQYLEFFCDRHSNEEINNILDHMASLNVLVIGDTILDEYQYCEVIGKSSKDPVLAMKYQSHDLFAGGVLAVANHAANFADHVKLVTILGAQDSHEEFIHSQLAPNISPQFYVRPDAPTLIKRRFIEGYSTNKLFEVYVMDDSRISSELDSQVCSWLKEHMAKYDIVIAADFGHGTISRNIVRSLTSRAPFLAVNAQANAGNRGFHTISRYPRADFACIAEHEIRLEMRDLTGSVRPMVEVLAKQLDCQRFVVTRGRKGCIIRGEQGELLEAPSFTSNVVDRVGAGDAFFAVTALAAAQSVSGEIIGFIGNIVGSLAVGILGNQKAIDKLSVKQHIESLMKKDSEYRLAANW